MRFNRVLCPIKEEMVDIDIIESELLDVESEIVDVGAALTERACTTTLHEYLLQPDLLSALSPANRLNLMRNSRLQKRLTPNSASAPPKSESETDQVLQQGLGQQAQTGPTASADRCITAYLHICSNTVNSHYAFINLNQ